MRVTYVGHATLLLEVGGATLLTDPNFDPSLGPFAVGRRLRRVSAPGVALAALPRLDAVLVSHAHVDHLSLDSLRALVDAAERGGVPAPPVVAPPVIARWLRARGFASAVGLEPGDRMRVGAVDAGAAASTGVPLTVHAAAATHVGARWGALDRWRGRDAALMYLVDGGEAGAAFFAGDTALTPGTPRLVADVLHAVGRALDLALLPIGHAPAWKRATFRAGHLTAEDALALFAELDARWLVPYHWGTFNHVTSGAFDAVRELRALVAAGRARGDARSARVRVLEPGEQLEVFGAAV